MSEIVSYLDWVLSQKNPPRVEVPKDIEDEEE